MTTYSVSLVFNFGNRKVAGLSLEDARQGAVSHLRKLGFVGDNIKIETLELSGGAQIYYSGVFGEGKKRAATVLAVIESENAE